MHKFEVHFPQTQVTVVEQILLHKEIDTQPLIAKAEKLFGYKYEGTGYKLIVHDAPLDQVMQVMNWWRFKFHENGIKLGFAP